MDSRWRSFSLPVVFHVNSKIADVRKTAPLRRKRDFFDDVFLDNTYHGLL